MANKDESDFKVQMVYEAFPEIRFQRNDYQGRIGAKAYHANRNVKGGVIGVVGTKSDPIVSIEATTKGIKRKGHKGPPPPHVTICKAPIDEEDGWAAKMINWEAAARATLYDFNNSEKLDDYNTIHSSFNNHGKFKFQVQQLKHAPDGSIISGTVITRINDGGEPEEVTRDTYLTDSQEAVACWGIFSMGTYHMETDDGDKLSGFKWVAQNLFYKKWDAFESIQTAEGERNAKARKITASQMI